MLYFGCEVPFSMVALLPFGVTGANRNKTTNIAGLPTPVREPTIDKCDISNERFSYLLTLVNTTSLQGQFFLAYLIAASLCFWIECMLEYSNRFLLMMLSLVQPHICYY